MFCVSSPKINTPQSYFINRTSFPPRRMKFRSDKQHKLAALTEIFSKLDRNSNGNLWHNLDFDLRRNYVRFPSHVLARRLNSFNRFIVAPNGTQVVVSFLHPVIDCCVFIFTILFAFVFTSTPSSATHSRVDVVKQKAHNQPNVCEF